MFDVFCLKKKFLVFNLVSRDLKIKYRRSLLGFFWTILHPLTLCFIYYFVFKVILKVEIPHYTSFVLSGVMPWIFFSSSVIEGTETLYGNASLLTKVPIPPQVFPWVACLTNFTTFILGLPIILGLSLLSGVELKPSAIYLPFLCLALFFMTYFLTLILSVAYVHLRDLKHAITLVLQVWFYATPILYKVEMIPAQYRDFIGLNPLGILFVNFHRVFLGEFIPFENLLITLCWVFFFFLGALFVQQKYAQRTVEFL